MSIQSVLELLIVLIIIENATDIYVTFFTENSLFDLKILKVIMSGFRLVESLIIIYAIRS